MRREMQRRVARLSVRAQSLVSVAGESAPGASSD